MKSYSVGRGRSANLSKREAKLEEAKAERKSKGNKTNIRGLDILHLVGL